MTSSLPHDLFHTTFTLDSFSFVQDCTVSLPVHCGFSSFLHLTDYHYFHDKDIVNMMLNNIKWKLFLCKAVKLHYVSFSVHCILAFMKRSISGSGFTFAIFSLVTTSDRRPADEKYA